MGILNNYLDIWIKENGVAEKESPNYKICPEYIPRLIKYLEVVSFAFKHGGGAYIQPLGNYISLEADLNLIMQTDGDMGVFLDGFFKLFLQRCVCYFIPKFERENLMKFIKPMLKD